MPTNPTSLPQILPEQPAVASARVASVGLRDIEPRLAVQRAERQHQIAPPPESPLIPSQRARAALRTLMRAISRTATRCGHSMTMSGRFCGRSSRTRAEALIEQELGRVS